MPFEYYVRFRPDQDIELALVYLNVLDPDGTFTVYLVARGAACNEWSAKLSDPEGHPEGVPIQPTDAEAFDMAWEYLDHAIITQGESLTLRIPREDNYSPLAMSSESFDPDLLCSASFEWPFTLRFHP
jgi:hypothetical protein